MAGAEAGALAVAGIGNLAGNTGALKTSHAIKVM
jgi:hypothetical protein